MNIGKRLESIGNKVPEGCILADIGTDHAYLPVWLLQQKKITSAIAGDIAQGPCLAAKNTVAMYGMKDKIEVRCGSGLKVLQSNEAGCISIAGMGGTTIIDILSADMEIAQQAKMLVLQPMAGAPSLRRWLCEHGWKLSDEDLVQDGSHLYEIIVAVRGESAKYSDAEYEVGPCLLAEKHTLLSAQLQKLILSYQKTLKSMDKSSQAKESAKYRQMSSLLVQLEALADECKCS
jgi:tRNA (adenine22-N1)-methyltransferase